MSKSKSREQLSRTELADKLSRLAEQIRSGKITTEPSSELILSDQMTLEIEIEDDELKLEVKWKPPEP